MSFCFKGEEDRLREVILRLGCLPLAERQLQFVKRNLAALSAIVFGLAIASATLGFLSLPIALASAATAMVLLNIVPAREIYESIDWPVVVLIGAMIPIGQALEETGATKLAVESFLGTTSGFSPVVILTLLLILTMMLSDVLNNAATAVVMAPFGWTLAMLLGVNPDAFLMAVAIGASCAFSHAHRTSKQPFSNGTWGIPFRRLLANRPPFGNSDCGHFDSDASLGVAVVIED